MDRSARNYPLEDIDRETMFHPNTSIVDHLKKGPHIVAEARGVRVKDHQGRELRAEKTNWGDPIMRAKLADAYLRAGGDNEKAARILNGSARLAKKRYLDTSARDHRQKAS